MNPFAKVPRDHSWAILAFYQFWQHAKSSSCLSVDPLDKIRRLNRRMLWSQWWPTTHIHTHTHIRRHICSQMLAQCERQVRQGRSDILGPIRSRSSDRPCALTARKGHQFVFIGSSHCSAQWSDLFVCHYSQSSSDVSTNLRAALFSHICLVTLKILHKSSKDRRRGWSKFVVVEDFIRFNICLDTLAGNHFDIMLKAMQ